MVEYNVSLDAIFLSLADSTRRDMLQLLQRFQSLTIGEIARHYKITFAGVAKHIAVLERASLVCKTKLGREQHVSLNATTIKLADDYLQQYQAMWQDRFNRLELLVKEKEI